jgi:hypothetical protein
LHKPLIFAAIKYLYLAMSHLTRCSVLTRCTMTWTPTPWRTASPAC